ARIADAIITSTSVMARRLVAETIHLLFMGKCPSTEISLDRTGAILGPSHIGFDQSCKTIKINHLRFQRPYQRWVETASLHKRSAPSKRAPPQPAPVLITKTGPGVRSRAASAPASPR